MERQHFSKDRHTSQAYLFVHFREKTSPDGEQVYFGLSRDGFHWTEANHGQPTLWAYYGDKGVRDFCAVQCASNGMYYILATDLSLAYGMRGKYHNSWKAVSEHGSTHLAIWESPDAVNWSEQRLIEIGDGDFGCVWAPDIIYDREHGDYVLHWSSSHRSNDYGFKSIYYSRTRDFHAFCKPQVLYTKADSGVIDSAIYEEDGRYYLFVKSEGGPAKIILMVSDHAVGPWKRVEAFDESMADCEPGKYEAPAAFRLEDGRWCLFLDYYGHQRAHQGYVPFVADSLASGRFTLSDETFSFPCGYKHGCVLPITEQQHDAILAHDYMYED